MNLAVPLPSDVHGSFEIQVGSESVYIDVLEYEPAIFQLKSDSSGVFGPSEPVRVPVYAGYYFGKPLSGAKARWSLNAHTERPRPQGWDKYHFGMERDDVQTNGRMSSARIEKMRVRRIVPILVKKIARDDQIGNTVGFELHEDIVEGMKALGILGV